ncbi:hypothetical protein [Streptomyces sp. NPDC101776]|uniref:hypothetical protein n=1 Tax=Streptomyces sp. NPDC101776 TaxID=3366146 RepID=UPI0038056056
MTTAEETAAAELAARHEDARQKAYAWALRATTEYAQAVRHEDDARARQNHDSVWQRDRMAEDRRLADFHGVRSTEALKLAEMWARVAAVLIPPLEPLWAEVENTHG